MGRNMAITSTAIGAAMVKGANDAIKLQNQYRVINNLAVYGGEKQSKVTKNVGKMQNQAAKYSTQYGVAQTKLSAGYEELVRRGYDSNQVLAAQKTFLQGSLASGDDYTDVVHNGAAALEQFGMRTKNTNQMMQNTKTVINQMAYAADLTATDFQGMGDAFRYVGNTAHTANQSVAETAAGVGILSNAGMEDTVAGTGYRKVLNSFLSPNMGKMSQQAPIMEKFGWTKKSFEDSKGNLKSIADLMDMVNKKTKNMGGAEKADVFKRFFGTTGQEAAIALSRDTKGLRRLTDQVSRSQNMKGGGYIAQLSKKNLMSAKAQIDIFKQAVSGLGISFATTVLPNITGLVKGLDKMLFAINEMPKGTKKFVTSGIALAAGIAPISLALGGLLKGISMAKTAWSSMAKVMRKPINGGSLQSASNATEAIANEEETAVGSTGSRMGTTHFSNAKNSVRGSGFKSQWNNSSLMGKLAVGAVGLDIGYDFVKATKQGLDTAAGGQTLWNGAGKTIGGGLGFYLGGPQGAVMGASIGDGITKALTAKKIDKYLSSNSTGKDPNAKIVEKDKHQQKKLRKRYYTQGTPDSDDANKVLGQLNSKPFRHQRKSKASDPYKGLSKDTK
ncbi:SLT domain protein [Levilactobacillus senmaizukei DSM 21775 = NBRC 103853]|uniref:SLT domain protein n=1 Tax=Levilactobacillus senmaizukei DSM 21775 = NBRC 103853 TaxID=1423803 RepID=A0A0R2DE13_9LACO|nr:SLT domain protein [Levilactobacillus senmaizukei DSM 21775 = NBRC 103853]